MRLSLGTTIACAGIGLISLLGLAGALPPEGVAVFTALMPAAPGASAPLGSADPMAIFNLLATGGVLMGAYLTTPQRQGAGVLVEQPAFESQPKEHHDRPH